MSSEALIGATCSMATSELSEFWATILAMSFWTSREPYPELITPPRRSGELIALPVLGGVQHDYRLAA
jgi:hypothetical protein